MFLELAFWLPLLGILYAYVGYPLCIVVAAKLFGRPPRPSGRPPRSVSIIIAAHNEESCIATRISELTKQIARLTIPGELIVVSDGSTDNTVAVARACAHGGTHVIDLEANEGKAVALNAGCAAATGEIFVFADARQTWAPDALEQLLKSFRDPTVGAVSGNLVLDSPLDSLTGVGAYWRFEKWLRKQESRLHSLIGVTGAISACRAALYKSIPKGTLLDDVYWPLQVAMQRFRIIHETDAVAYDRLPLNAGGEFRRKVRTLCGMFQLLVLCPQAWIPWRNPVWVQLISHKFLRLLVPWGMLSILAANIALAGPFYRIALWIQLGFYLLGLIGLSSTSRRWLALTRAIASFILLNCAAWLAFWVWLLGNSRRTWSKVPYPSQPLEYSGNRN